MSFKAEETQQQRRLPVFTLRQEVRRTAVLFGSLIEEGDFFFRLTERHYCKVSCLPLALQI